jgi:hypothetical protein
VVAECTELGDRFYTAGYDPQKLSMEGWKRYRKARRLK